ncbi:hypothetical protein C8J57DRAFT_1712151 [Mycena rebaudengoi]|nr:hypothetical protein C8J57DRAFT_1712151 [Mycena rebaudengoi]
MKVAQDGFPLVSAVMAVHSHIGTSFSNLVLHKSSSRTTRRPQPQTTQPPVARPRHGRLCTSKFNSSARTQHLGSLSGCIPSRDENATPPPPSPPRGSCACSLISTGAALLSPTWRRPHTVRTRHTPVDPPAAFVNAPVPPVVAPIGEAPAPAEHGVAGPPSSQTAPSAPVPSCPARGGEAGCTGDGDGRGG